MNKKIITILIIIVAVLAVLLLIYAVSPALLQGSLVGGKKRFDLGGERGLIVPGVGKEGVNLLVNALNEIFKKKGVGVMDEIDKKKITDVFNEISRKKGVGVMDEIDKKKITDVFNEIGKKREPAGVMDEWSGGAEGWKR